MPKTSCMSEPRLRAQELGDELVEQLGAFPLHPVAGCDVITSSALGIRLSSIGPPDGRFTLSSRPHSTSVGVARSFSRLSRVRSIRHSVRSAVGPDGRRSGGSATTSGSIEAAYADVDQFVGHRCAVVDKVRPDERLQLVAARPVAAVVRQQAFQSGSRAVPSSCRCRRAPSAPACRRGGACPGPAAAPRRRHRSCRSGARCRCRVRRADHGSCRRGSRTDRHWSTPFAERP